MHEELKSKSFELEFAKKRRVPAFCGILWFFFGIWGAHRFYLKKYFSAFVLLSLSLFSIITFIAIVFILENRGNEYLQEHFSRLILMLRWAVVIVSVWWLIDLFLWWGMTKRQNDKIWQSITHEKKITQQPHYKDTIADTVFSFSFKRFCKILFCFILMPLFLIILGFILYHRFF